jgi:NAD(P)-dependent dehydrogenase (short-subunit alcohol dehydrogenase family)
MRGQTGGVRIDLTGRTALVTGAGGGIGFAIASALAAAGARVALNDRDAAAVGACAAQIGDPALAVVGDVSEPASVEEIVARASMAGSLDILVNNAGLSEVLAPIERQEPAEWDDLMGVNLRGPFLMSRAALPHLKASGAGAIVNIASIAGLVGFPASHGYGVSKAGLAMMTKTLACEVAKFGVRVNAVAPGVIDAPMLERMTGGRARLGAVVGRVPMGRLGAASEVAAAVAFLCSDAAAYITGAVLPVDGGWSAYGGAGPASRPPNPDAYRTAGDLDPTSAASAGS